MNKKLVLILFIVLLFPSAKALQVLSIDYIIFKNDTASLNVRVIDSTVFIPKSSSEEYKMLIKDFKNQTLYSLNLPVMFYIFDFIGGRETDSSLGYLRVEWKNTSKYIDVLHNNKVIYSTDLSAYLCSLNGLCEPEKGETPYLCLLDCHCGNRVCEKNFEEDEINCPQDCFKKPFDISLIVYGLIVCIIFVLVFLFIRKLKVVKE